MHSSDDQFNKKNVIHRRTKKRVKSEDESDDEPLVRKNKISTNNSK